MLRSLVCTIVCWSKKKYILILFDLFTTVTSATLVFLVIRVTLIPLSQSPYDSTSHPPTFITVLLDYRFDVSVVNQRRPFPVTVTDLKDCPLVPHPVL